MPQYLLHAGNLKTGSTAIQSFLKGRLAAVEAAADLVIPGFGASAGRHGALVAKPGFGGPGYDWDQLARDVAASGKGRVLLSSELFIREPAESLKARLDAAGAGRTDVYFYFRPHIEMVTAQVAQNVKTGFRLAGVQLRAATLMRFREMNFVAALRDFHAVFGRDRVHSREFARDRLIGQDVVQDFVDFLRLPPEILQAGPAVAEPVNVTPPAEVLALLHLLRLGFGEAEGQPGPRVQAVTRQVMPRLQAGLIAGMKGLAQTRFRLPLATQVEIKETFEAERIFYFNETAGFEPSPRWLDEPVEAPDPVQGVPAEVVHAAIARTVAALPEAQKPLGRILRRLAEQMPLTVEGGVPTVAVADLPMFGAQGARQNAERHAVRLAPETEDVVLSGVTFHLARAADTPARFVMGLRKCGSSMLSQIMEELAERHALHSVDLPGRFFKAGIRFPEWQEMDLTEVIRSGNMYVGFRACPAGLLRNEVFARSRRVFMFRDPRDALVSQYFSDAYSHSLPTEDGAQADKARADFLAKREKSLATDINDYVLQNAVSMDRTFTAYAEVLNSPLTLALRYEEHIFQKKRMITKIAAHFGLEMTGDDIEVLLAKFDIVPGAEDPKSFIRNVTPGDHRRKLKPETIAKLDARLKNSLALYDYH